MIDLYTSVGRWATGIALWAFAGMAATAATSVSLYHDPLCGCCHQYAAHLRDAGFKVDVQPMGDARARFEQAGVALNLASCHMMTIDDYVVVGHVPLSAIDKLRTERPDIKGIALPGMPIGTPGMPGPKQQPFVVRTLAGDIYTRI